MSSKVDGVKREIEDTEKQGLTPKLRFPEFLDAGEWETKRLGTVLQFQAGFPFDSAGFTEEVIGLRLVRNRDLRSDDRILFYSKRFDDRFIVSDGDVLIGMDGDFSPCVWNKGNALLNQRVGRILPLKESSLRFLYYFLTVHLKAIEENTAWTTVKHLSHSDVEKINEPIPSFSEQTKIADCLSSLDELITAQSQKLDALKTHKKGLMQQLFPAEGETVPRLRFPEFLDAEDWEERQLSTIAKLTSSKRVHLSDYVSNGIPFFRGKEISLLRNNQIPDDILYISEEYYHEIREQHGVPEIGDILITAVGTLGNIYCVKNSDKFYFKDGNLIWMKNISEDSTFLEILLNAKSKYVLSSAIGSSQKALTIVELNKLKFTFPERDEQQKIADCLSSLDELITAQSQKLEALKTHKKGLMQQLFPVRDEVNE